VLVAPRLILIAADFLPEKTGDQISFQVLDCSAAVVRFWMIGGCALGEL
jgi:hypothetical protein